MVKEILNKKIRLRFILPIVLLVSLMGGYFCGVSFRAMAAEDHAGITGERYHIPRAVDGYCDGSANHEYHHSIGIVNNSQQSFGTVFFPATNLSTNQFTTPKSFLGYFQLSHYLLFKTESSPQDNILRC